MKTPKYSVYLAFIAAMLLHASLLLITRTIGNGPRVEPPLSVTLIKEHAPETPEETRQPSIEEPISSVEPEPVEEPQPNREPQPIKEPQPTITKPTHTPVIASDILVDTRQSKNSQEKPNIQVSTQSESFKKWLALETDSFANKNSESVGKFNQSFKARSVYQSPKELSPFQGNPSFGGSTDYVTEYKGKRTCHLEIINLLDASGSPTFITKDCTPPKKFELNLKQPNNG